MTKIFQIDSHSGYGGGQKILFDIIDGLKNKFKFTVVAPAGVFLRKHSQAGSEVRELGDSNSLKIIKTIRKLIEQDAPDIVHAHGTRAASWVRLAIIGVRQKPKIIYTLHGFQFMGVPFSLRMVLLFLERVLNRWTDVLCCVSNSEKETVLKYRTIRKNKITVVKNGVDIAKLQVNPSVAEAKKEEMGLSNNLILTTIGRLHYQKDFSTVLKALKRVCLQIKNVKLLIVGDGPLRESLEKETKSLELSEYVKFLGFQDEVAMLINLSDMVILSTRWEGLPLVPLEAGAARKTVIVSNVIGARETIVDKVTGYTFKLGGDADLAGRILELATSKKLRDKIGNSAFEFVSKNFSKEKMVERYEQLYKRLSQKCFRK